MVPRLGGQSRGCGSNQGPINLAPHLNIERALRHVQLKDTHPKKQLDRNMTASHIERLREFW